MASACESVRTCVVVSTTREHLVVVEHRFTTHWPSVKGRSRRLGERAETLGWPPSHAQSPQLLHFQSRGLSMSLCSTQKQHKVRAEDTKLMMMTSKDVRLKHTMLPMVLQQASCSRTSASCRFIAFTRAPTPPLDATFADIVSDRQTASAHQCGVSNKLFRFTHRRWVHEREAPYHSPSSHYA